MQIAWRGLCACALTLAAPLAAQAQQHLRDAEIHDADTLAWWHTTEALSNDGMEGRDTGSAAYQRAADYVANRFKAAGLVARGRERRLFPDRSDARDRRGPRGHELHADRPQWRAKRR